jgi:hypothetical protein
MRWPSVHRPSPSMGVALTALVIASGATAAATTRLIAGDSLIEKASLSGNRLRNHTIGDAQLNLRRLGKVPRAGQADIATEATAATTAGRIGMISYGSAPFTASADSRTTAHVSCGPGTFAVGGGTSSPDEHVGFSDFLIDSHPTPDRAGWEVTVENETAGDLTETGWVVCLPAASTG